MKRSFFCSFYVYFMVSLWVVLFAIGTIVTFVIYGILRLLFLKKVANSFMWASARFWSRLITLFLGAKVTVYGKENLPKTKDGHYCIVGNHESYLDITNILGFCKLRTGFVAKNELKAVPFLNIWMVAFGCTFIKRGTIKSSIDAINNAVKNIKKGVQMVIFPEGHRAKNGHIEAFKPGALKLALRSKATIIPIAMTGSRSTFEGRMSIKPFPRIKISVLPLIDVNELSKEEKDNLALTLETNIKQEAERLKSIK